MKKADATADRQTIKKFQQIINVGSACEEDFGVLEIGTPQHLIGRDPWELYEQLCLRTDKFHDPCVLDVMISTIDYMNGNPPQKWWAFTELRKQKYSRAIQTLRAKMT